MTDVSPRYVPQRITSFVEDSELARLIELELYRVASVLPDPNVDTVLFQELTAEPRNYEGLVVAADGTSWDPGDGQGLYVFINGAWNYLIGSGGAPSTWVEIAGDTMTGPLIQSDTTNSASSTTGSIQTAGGLGVEQDVWIGGDITFDGANPEILGNDSDGTLSISAGTTRLSGSNITLYGETQANAGNIRFSDNTTATLEYLAASSLWNFHSNNIINVNDLTVDNNVDVTGTITVESTTNSTSTTTGSIQTDGGLGVDQDVWIGGDVDVAGNMAIGSLASVEATKLLNIKESLAPPPGEVPALNFEVEATGTSIGAIPIGLNAVVVNNTIPGFGLNFNYPIGVRSVIQQGASGKPWPALGGSCFNGQISSASGSTAAMTSPSVFLASAPTLGGAAITSSRGMTIASMGAAGKVTNAIGIWINEQASASGSLYGIVLDGDGDGGGIFFGASQDASIYFDGNNLIIDPDLITADQRVLIGATGDDDIQFNDAFVDGDVVINEATGHGIKVDTTDPTFPWHDLLGKITNGLGANKPTSATYRGGILQFQFNATTNDEAMIEFHMPHDYAAGTDVHLHVHWSHISAIVTGGTATFTYELSYAEGHDQAAFTAPVTGTIVGNASTTQYQHIISEGQVSTSGGSGTQLDTDNLEPDGLILCRIAFTTNGITSSGAVPDIFIHQVDIHYQSTNIGTKSKAPGFYT